MAEQRAFPRSGWGFLYAIALDDVNQWAFTSPDVFITPVESCLYRYFAAAQKDTF
jgi:hypothetical protein